MEDSETETVKQIDALLDSKAADDDQLACVDGVDLGSHHDVFDSILKQVRIAYTRFCVLSFKLLRRPSVDVDASAAHCRSEHGAMCLC